MRWQYKYSFILFMLSYTLFFALALYNTDSGAYYPNGDLEMTPTWGYSWIWYHPEQWIFSLILDLAALAVFVHGLIKDIRDSSWRISDYIKIQIVEETEDT